MAAGVNLLQLFDADLGVNGGGVELLMPKQLLDVADVRPALKHVRGAGVPEQMAASLFGQARLLDPFRHHAAENVRVERPAVAGEKQRLGVRVRTQARADLALQSLPLGQS